MSLVPVQISVLWNVFVSLGPVSERWQSALIQTVLCKNKKSHKDSAQEQLLKRNPTHIRLLTIRHHLSAHHLSPSACLPSVTICLLTVCHHLLAHHPSPSVCSPSVTICLLTIRHHPSLSACSPSVCSPSVTICLLTSLTPYH